MSCQTAIIAARALFGFKTKAEIEAEIKAEKDKAAAKAIGETTRQIRDETSAFRRERSNIEKTADPKALQSAAKDLQARAQALRDEARQQLMRGNYAQANALNSQAFELESQASEADWAARYAQSYQDRQKWDAEQKRRRAERDERMKQPDPPFNNSPFPQYDLGGEVSGAVREHGKTRLEDKTGYRIGVPGEGIAENLKENIEIPNENTKTVSPFGDVTARGVGRIGDKVNEMIRGTPSRTPAQPFSDVAGGGGSPGAWPSRIAGDFGSFGSPSGATPAPPSSAWKQDLLDRIDALPSSGPAHLPSAREPSPWPSTDQIDNPKAEKSWDEQLEEIESKPRPPAKKPEPKNLR
jgi:hypothetical protein